MLYGFGNPLSKIGFRSITVLWCLGIRFSGAAILMLLLFGRRTVRSLRAAPVKAWLPCSLAMAVAYASCNMALQFTTATNVGFLMSLPGIDPVSMATAQAAVTGVLCLTAALLFDDAAVLPQVTTTAWLVVAYLALTCTCLSYVLQNTALTRLSSYTVSLLQCTQPILTAACSYLLLRERLTAVGLTGAAIIVACVVWENWQSGRQQNQRRRSPPDGGDFFSL